MNTIMNQSPFSPWAQGNLPDSRSYSVQQTRAGSISQNQSTDLRITTDEGDTVTISLSSKMALDAGIYTSYGYEDGRATSSQSSLFQFDSRQDMAITVNGELNEEESAQVQEAIATIGTMIEDFLSGDVKQMVEDGNSLQELDTISSLEASFSYERQVLYGEQDRVEIEGKSSPGHKNGHHKQLIRRMDQLTDDMVEQVKGFPGRHRLMARSIEKLLDRYGKGEKKGRTESNLQQKVVDTLHSVFVQKLQSFEESFDFNLNMQ